jgi:hypothetical protein
MSETAIYTVTGEEILQYCNELINKRRVAPLKPEQVENVRIDISETGDVDKGTYRRVLKGIVFEIREQ